MTLDYVLCMVCTGCQLCVHVCVRQRQEEREAQERNIFGYVIFWLFLNDSERIWTIIASAFRNYFHSSLEASIIPPCALHTSEAHSIIHSCWNIVSILGQYLRA